MTLSAGLFWRQAARDSGGRKGKGDRAGDTSLPSSITRESLRSCLIKAAAMRASSFSKWQEQGQGTRAQHARLTLLALLLASQLVLPQSSENSSRSSRAVLCTAWLNCSALSHTSCTSRRHWSGSSWQSWQIGASVRCPGPWAERCAAGSLAGSEGRSSMRR